MFFLILVLASVLLTVGIYLLARATGRRQAMVEAELARRRQATKITTQLDQTLTEARHAIPSLSDDDLALDVLRRLDDLDAYDGIRRPEK